jgi:hypothetical protein
MCIFVLLGGRPGLPACYTELAILHSPMRVDGVEHSPANLCSAQMIV